MPPHSLTLSAVGAGMLWVGAATAAWSAVATFPIVKGADPWIGARVDEEQELVGLDLANHEERGYDE